MLKSRFQSILVQLVKSGPLLVMAMILLIRPSTVLSTSVSISSSCIDFVTLNELASKVAGRKNN